MENRRAFLIKGSLSLMAMQIPFAGCSKNIVYGSPKRKEPKTAAVFWYSQTGNTQRTGKLIAKTLEKNGIKTTSSDYRNFDRNTLSNFDLIVAGSPVYYYDVPSNFKNWLRQIPKITDASVASYVTFGGEGGNQYNTSRELAEFLAEKGGIPVGTAEFGNMSTFAITWSTGNEKRVLKYKDRPNETSFNSIRQYTSLVLGRIRQGLPADIEKEFDFRDMIKNGPSIWGTKICINRHTIDNAKCVECGVCTDKCPVGAIGIEKGRVDNDLCIACLGCVNNCPTGAIDMAFLNKKVYGFNEFIKRHKITISEPKELIKSAEHTG